MTGRHTRHIVFTVLATVVLSAPVDAQQALADLHARAEQGNAEAQFNLGLKYAHGEGVPRNDLEAVYWYRQAAEQGYVSAEYNLEWMISRCRSELSPGCPGYTRDNVNRLPMIDESEPVEPFPNFYLMDERTCGNLLLQLKRGSYEENQHIHLEAREDGQLVYREQVADDLYADIWASFRPNEWIDPSWVGRIPDYVSPAVHGNLQFESWRPARPMREVPISAPFLFCEDITGNGIPNVVVDLSCGCSMATGSTHIFELHPEFILREVFSSTGTTGYAVNTVADLDGDGVMEFIVSEHYYFPFFDYKAHPSSRVVLRWTGSTYALDLDLMRHLPSPEGYQSVLEEAKQLWGSSDEREKKAQGWRLYNAVIDLIYSGNWDTAWKLFDDVLPTGFRGSSKEELLVKIIKESHYGLEILAEYAGASTQYKLGEVYANRDSVSSDWAEAVRWSHLYGSRNSWVKSGRAVPDFGEFQEQRRQALEAIFPDWVESVFPNWVEAEKRYRRAANLGMADAMARLGVMYAGGRPGVSQDNVQAHVWYGLAASRLAPERLGRVVEFRDFLADQMTVDQLSEAERLSREFDAEHPREP